MEKFFYCNKTAITLDDDALLRVGEIVASYNYKKVLLVYGGSSLVKSGGLIKVLDSLAKEKIETFVKGGVGVNPDISFVRETIVEARNFRPDIILAVGGGSVLDAAKSIANGYYYEGDALDFNKHLVKPIKALPIGTIITLAAAGSEMSSSCVISDRANKFKAGFNSPTNYPLFSILDPNLVKTVPKYQIACGLVDIISHSFERYFSPSAPYEVSDYLALGVIKQVVDLTPAVMKKEFDYEAHKAMMLSATVSHNGFTSFGKNYIMKCHYVEHLISGVHPEVAHGQGLAWLMDPFLRLNQDLLFDKILEFGRIVFNVDSVDKTLSSFQEYIFNLNLQKTMEEAGISTSEKESYIKLLSLDK